MTAHAVSDPSRAVWKALLSVCEPQQLSPLPSWCSLSARELAGLYPITDSRTPQCPSLSPEITRSLETERMCSLPPSLSPVTCLEEADHSLAAVNAALCSQHGCNLYFSFPLVGRRAEPGSRAGSVLLPCLSLGFPALK